MSVVSAGCGWEPVSGVIAFGRVVGIEVAVVGAEAPLVVEGAPPMMRVVGRNGAEFETVAVGRMLYTPEVAVAGSSLVADVAGGGTTVALAVAVVLTDTGGGTAVVGTETGGGSVAVVFNETGAVVGGRVVGGTDSVTFVTGGGGGVLMGGGVETGVEVIGAEPVPPPVMPLPLGITEVEVVGRMGGTLMLKLGSRVRLRLGSRVIGSEVAGEEAAGDEAGGEEAATLGLVDVGATEGDSVELGVGSRALVSSDTTWLRKEVSGSTGVVVVEVSTGVLLAAEETTPVGAIVRAEDVCGTEDAAGEEAAGEEVSGEEAAGALEDAGAAELLDVGVTITLGTEPLDAAPPAEGAELGGVVTGRLEAGASLGGGGGT